MSDFTFLNDYFVVVVIVACLVIGYIIKHATFFKWISNDNIPVILAIFGAILNPLVSGLSIESIVYGAVMGLSSTGLHQAFNNFINNKNNDSE